MREGVSIVDMVSDVDIDTMVKDLGVVESQHRVADYLRKRGFVQEADILTESTHVAIDRLAAMNARRIQERAKEEGRRYGQYLRQDQRGHPVA